MDNPWVKLQKKEPFLLESDKDQILAFNVKAKPIPIVKIQHHIYPEPYIGNPKAPIILLN